MWNLLKAELEYHKFSLATAAVLISGLFTFILGWGWDSLETDGRGMIKLLIVTNIFLWLIRFIRILKDKTDRHHLILPLSMQKIGLARNLAGMAVWMSLLLIFWIELCLIRPSNVQAWIFWYTLSVSGIWFVVIAMPLIRHDLTFIFSKKYQKFIIFGVYLLLIAVLILLFSADALQRYFSIRTAQAAKWNLGESNATFIGAMIFLLLGLGACYASTGIFQRRRSYLE